MVDILPASPQELPAETVKPLYDKQFFSVALPSPEQIKANPGRFEEIKDQPVYMLSPENKPFSLPALKASEAVSSGWRFLPPDTAQNLFLKQNKEEYYRKQYDNAFSVAASNLISAGTGGILEEKDPARLKALAEAEEKYPAFKYGGLAVGAIGNLAATSPMLATEGVGTLGRIAATESEGALARMLAGEGAQAGKIAATQTLEKAAPGLLAKVGQAAAKGAQEGALAASPQASAQLLTGDPEKAAETLLMASGINGAIGLGIGGFSAAAKGLGKVSKLSSLADVEGNLQASALKNTANTLESKFLGIGKKAGETLGEEGLNIAKTVAKEKGLKKFSLEELATIQKEVQASFEQETNTLDKVISKVKDPTVALTQTGVSGGIDPAKLASKIENDILETHPALKIATSGENKKAYDQLVKIITSVVDRAEVGESGIKPIKFSEVNNIIKEVSDYAGKDLIGKQALGILEAERNQAMLATLQRINDPERTASFLNLQQKNQVVSYLAQLPPEQFTQVSNNIPLMKSVTDFLSNKVGKGVGAFVGGKLGGWSGAGLGYVVGGAASKYLAHIGENQVLPLAISKLRNIANDPSKLKWLAPVLSHHGSELLANKILDRVGKITASGSAAISKGIVNKINKGDYDQVSKALSFAQANPSSLDQEIGALGSIFDDHPELKMAVSNKTYQAVNYLASQLPKNPTNPGPFQNNNNTWEPSPRDKKSFMDKVEVVNDPTSVLEHIKNGSLSIAHIQALDAVYPKIKGEMISKLIEMGMEASNKSILPGIKQGIEMMTQSNINNPMMFDYQRAYQQIAPEQPANPQIKSRKQRGVKLDKLPNIQLPYQKLEYK